jgi:lipopolysaccharide/colanic/teichoic acid biosynthesis glycosyltransferase
MASAMSAASGNRQAGGKKLAVRDSARWLDVGGALFAVTLLSPVLLLAGMVVLIDDGRPILFRQKRVGKNGKLFDILKFRTMRAGSGGSAVTAAGDQRITRIGARLRKYKLDELPQFFNVLRGHMSLIGPRPEVPEYVEPDDYLWQAVLQVRPGITDLATLIFRDEEQILSVADPGAYYRSNVLPEKLRLSIQYQQSRSLLRDFKLLWMTARYSFNPRGFDRDRVVKSLGISDRKTTDKKTTYE